MFVLSFGLSLVSTHFKMYTHLFLSLQTRFDKEVLHDSAWPEIPGSLSGETAGKISAVVLKEGEIILFPVSPTIGLESRSTGVGVQHGTG